MEGTMEYTVELEKEEIKGNKEIAYILLKSKVPYFVDTDVKVEESTVSITSIIKESYTDFDYVKTLILEEKLRYLINLSEVYTGVENTNYTYNFDTNSVVFTKDIYPTVPPNITARAAVLIKPNFRKFILFFVILE